MRWMILLGFALAMGATGCSDSGGAGPGGGGGTGGAAGAGGTGGEGGAAGAGGAGGEGGAAGAGGTGGAGDLCMDRDCSDGNECTEDVCSPLDGACSNPNEADGTACTRGECLDGVCAPVGAFPCTEQGVRDAIAEGGGPHFFACNGPTMVVTSSPIVIDNDVILDGEGALTIDGNDDHRVFSVLGGNAVALRGIFIVGGRAGDGGAGIQNEGTLALTDSTVSGNTADGVGGGIGNEGTLTLMNSTVSGNVSRGIFNGFGATLTLTNSTVSGNTLRGIENFSFATLTLMNSTVSGNAGIGIINRATLTLTNSTVSGNAGNGIANELDATLTLTNSTVSGNTADGVGGGILNNQGIVTLTNSTVSGNTGDTSGGGIFNSGMLTLTNSTVSGNTADSGGGIDSATTATLTNSLVVGNGCSGSLFLSSGGYNVESPGNTCGLDQPTDQVDVSTDDVKLGPLADNGGPTMTHALGTGSIAIDVIPGTACVDADAAPLTTDQRGEPRPETGGTVCDVGAFELQP